MKCTACDTPIDHRFRLCVACNENGIIWAAKRARRERIEQEAISSYVSSMQPTVGPFAKVEVEVKRRGLGAPKIEVEIVGLNGNANEDEPLTNVLGSNVVTLGDGCKMIEPEAQLANATSETYRNPFMTGHRDW